MIPSTASVIGAAEHVVRSPETDEELVPCNLCGSTAREVPYTARDWRFRVDDRRYAVVRCQACGLGYLAPRPTPASIGRYYPAVYYRERAEDVAGERLTAQAEYVTNSRPRRLLDVGAAGGEFILYMRRRGWDVTGLEPHAPARIDPGLEIVESWEGLRDAEPFDVITAWSVFEHLHDPRAAFQQCRDHLRPGGRLVIHVPNLNSPLSRLARQEDVPRHLYFFTRAHVAALRRRNAAEPALGRA